jgi:hypothetical protein
VRGICHNVVQYAHYDVDVILRYAFVQYAQYDLSYQTLELERYMTCFSSVCGSKQLNDLSYRTL